MGTERAAGFWSYTHDDNVLDRNRVQRLAERVRDEYSLLTGDELELFVDRDALAWGEEWRARIEKALEGTAFFVPIITPRYFRSQECRNELLSFARQATSLGVEELLLPIHYVNVPALSAHESAADEAIRLVAAMQWTDWRKLRLVDEDSAEYIAGINSLATRLAEIADSVSGPTLERSAAGTPEAPSAGGELDAPDEPGVLELLAAGEEAMPRLNSTIQEFGGVLNNLGHVAGEYTEKLTASDARGAGFAGRLTVTKRLANAMDAPADRVMALGQAYSEDLVSVDGAIKTMIRAAEEDLSDDEAREARSLFSDVRGMAHASRDNAKQFSDLTKTLDEAAGMSRDLKKPVNQMKTGLRGVLDGQEVIDEWDRQIVAMYARRGEEPPPPTVFDE